MCAPADAGTTSASAPGGGCPGSDGSPDAPAGPTLPVLTEYPRHHAIPEGPGIAYLTAGDLAVPPASDELIAYGPLLSDNGAAWLGTVVLVRAANPDTARTVLTPDRYADIEVHNWQFGGRS